MNREQVERVRQLLAGGLHTDHKEDGILPEQAAVRVAAAQLRAIRFALAFDENADIPAYEDGRQGWCASNDRFDRQDAFIALGGVVALLESAKWLADEATNDLHLLALQEAAK